MNAVVIEQNPDDTKLAFEVNQNAVINRIRLARAKLTSQSIDEGPKGPIAVTFNFKSKPLAAPSNVLRLEIAFRMAGAEDEDEEGGARNTAEKKLDDKKLEPVVSVECAYEVDYALREDFSMTVEHVKAFKDGNAIFNTWPYFREYLQSSLQRMGLPPLTAPFLRLQPKLDGRNRVKKQPQGERTLPERRGSRGDRPTRKLRHS